MVFTTRYFVLLARYKAKAARLVVGNVNLAMVPEGVYEGSCEIGFVADWVRVTVKEHRIVDIAIVKDVSQKGPVALPVLDRVITAQSLHVDTVSGATNSSKVILKAIENALEKD